MANQLKKILIAIASLGKRDQRWIFDQLSPEEKKRFEQEHGYQLFKEAKRFRTMAGCLPDKPNTAEIPPPEWELIKDEPPLFIAIILEQGEYPWHQAFLKDHDKHGLIQQCLDNQMPSIKPLVKKTLFKEWVDSNAFAACLEHQHG